MPKGKKKPKKGQRKGAQRGPGNSAANQGATTPASQSPGPDQKAIDPADQATSASDSGSNEDLDAQKTKGPSPVGFAQSTKEELAKVVWPDRQQLISESAAVILMVSFLAIFISLIDNVFSWASRLVF